MHQGIFLEVNKEEDCQRTLEMIVRTLSSRNPGWLVTGLDCHYETDLVDGKYSTGELLHLLKTDSRVFEARMVSIAEGKNLSLDIRTGEDYLNSNAESIVFIADLAYFTVFSKTERLLKLIEEEVEKNQNIKVERIEQNFGGLESFA